MKQFSLDNSIVLYCYRKALRMVTWKENPIKKHTLIKINVEKNIIISSKDIKFLFKPIIHKKKVLQNMVIIIVQLI